MVDRLFHIDVQGVANTEKMKFEVKRLASSDVRRLGPLMETCFGSPVDESYFQWKYLDNPAGEVVGFEGYHDGKLVAFFGAIPEQYLVNGKPVRVYQAMDLMTHPDYQRRGLFSLLGTETYRAIAEEQGDVRVIGVPNYHILPGHVHKLGSRHIHSFSYLFMPRALFLAQRLLGRIPRLEIEPISAGGPELDRYFQEREASGKPISPVLGARFLEWRLLENRKYRYEVFGMRKNGELVGFCAYEPSPDGRYRIMMLDFKRRSDFRRYAITAVDHIFRTTTARFIYSWQPTDAEVAAGYYSAGFLRNPLAKGPFSFRFPFIVYSLTSKIHGVDWTDIRNFDLQPFIQD